MASDILIVRFFDKHETIYSQISKIEYFHVVTLETDVLAAHADTALWKFPQKLG
jgi:hypothetical protein